MHSWEKTQEHAFVIVPLSQQQLVEKDELVEEAVSLTRAIDLDVTWNQHLTVKRIRAGSYFGKGQIEHIKEKMDETSKPSVVIINVPLSPVQQRNLEKVWHTKVIDRTGLILEIFGDRAQTAEGKLQVELAALEYQKSRLVRSWTHLERQRGGAGFMGGPGERQIEIDRRLISERIVKIKKDIEHLRGNRALQREAREKVPYPIVALVGYTNAGKSSLFNALTKARVMVKDMLFATLDTTTRKIVLDNGSEALLSDTVGFIKDLPTELVAAFRATLEQVEYADIILHVQDVANEAFEAQAKEVNQILENMGVDPSGEHVFKIYNKIDLLSEDDLVDFQREEHYSKDVVLTSVESEFGLDKVLEIIEKFLHKNQHIYAINIPLKDGKAMAWLHEHGNVKNITTNKEHFEVSVVLSKAALDKFIKYFEYVARETH